MHRNFKFFINSVRKRLKHLTAVMSGLIIKGHYNHFTFISKKVSPLLSEAGKCSLMRLKQLSVFIYWKQRY